MASQGLRLEEDRLMPHLHPSPGADSAAAVELRDRIREATGRDPSPLFGELLARPDLARPLFEWFAAVMMSDGRLGRPMKEMIATRVSYANACRYCSALHAFRAESAGVSRDVIERLADPVDQLPLDDRGRALMAFCDKMRDASSTIDEADWAGLRDAGWEDEAILEAAHVVGMFSHFNRLADALGVEFTAPPPT
jgi:uncharacterized peroxidase-related enzyme